VSDNRTARNRTVALAGLVQASWLVREVANEGRAPAEAMEPTLGWLFTFDADSVVDALGGLERIRLGLELVRDQLNRPEDPNFTRYVMSLIHHAGSLRRRPELMEQLRIGLESNRERLAHFPILHPNLIAGLADTYSATVSTLKPRIMVRGEPRLLADTEVAAQVRALLLSGIRAAVLWQQCGGSRLSLLFARRALVAQARALATQIGSAA